MVTRTQTYAVDSLVGVHPAYRSGARLLVEFLDQRIPGVFADACDRLFELAADARSDVEQTRYFEGKREIELRKNRLCHAFGERVDRNLADFFKHRRAHITDPGLLAQDEGELRILDDRDLAVTLAVDNMVDSAEIRLTRDLYALSVRVGDMFKTSPIPNDINPLGPRVLCEAFRDTLVTVESEIEVHQALFKCFEKNIVRALPEAYSAINQELVDQGVVPDLKYAVVRKEGSSQTPEIVAEEHSASIEDPNVAAAASAIEHKLLDRVQQLLAQRRQAYWTPPAHAEAPTTSLLDVLSSLQSAGAAQELTSTAIKAQLLNQLTMDGQLASMAARDEDTVDMVGMMFDFVRADRQLPQPFQSALHKLQIPILRAALNDPQAVLERHAPARQLLEELAGMGMGWTEQSDRRGKTLAKVTQIVDAVIQDYRDDPAVLQELVNDLRNFRDSRNQMAERRAERAQQALKGREQLQFARQNVAQMLQRRTTDTRLPPLVKDLLEKAWAHVMVLAVLRHGTHSEQWKKAVAMVDELIWSVTFKKTEQSVTRLRTRLPVLAKALTKGLRTVGYQDAEIKKILFNLKKLYRSLIQNTGSDRVVVEASDQGLTIRGENIVEQAVLDETPVVDCPEALPEVLEELRGWKAGKWVMFHTDRGEPTRAKLSWISPITGHYLFVDQRGIKAAEKSVQELAEDLIGEKLEELNDASVVTRAMQDIADKLNSGLETSAAVH